MGVQYIAEVSLRLGIAQVGRPDIDRCGAGVQGSQSTYVQDLLTQRSRSRLLQSVRSLLGRNPPSDLDYSPLFCTSALAHRFRSSAAA